MWAQAPNLGADQVPKVVLGVRGKTLVAAYLDNFYNYCLFMAYDYDFLYGGMIYTYKIKFKKGVDKNHHCCRWFLISVAKLWGGVWMREVLSLLVCLGMSCTQHVTGTKQVVVGVYSDCWAVDPKGPSSKVGLGGLKHTVRMQCVMSTSSSVLSPLNCVCACVYNILISDWSNTIENKREQIPMCPT